MKVGYVPNKIRNKLSKYVIDIYDKKIIMIIEIIIKNERYSKKSYIEMQKYIKKFDINTYYFLMDEFNGFTQNIDKYKNKPVIYLILITNHDLMDRMFKIGYSDDIIGMLNSFDDTNIYYLFRLKNVTNIDDYINFNNSLKISYPELIEDTKINNYSSQMYLYSISFYNDFKQYIGKFDLDMDSLNTYDNNHCDERYSDYDSDECSSNSDSNECTSDSDLDEYNNHDIDKCLNKKIFNDIIIFKEINNMHQQIVATHIINKHHEYLLKQLENQRIIKEKKIESIERMKDKKYEFMLKMKDKSNKYNDISKN